MYCISDIVWTLEEDARAYTQSKGKCTMKKILDRVSKMDPDITEVDRFEDLYPRRLRHKDDLASIFIDPITLEFATGNPVVMNDIVYEQESLFGMFLYHLKKKNENYILQG